jgi:predicted nuclease of predicted toxin-antitoxin system
MAIRFHLDESMPNAVADGLRRRGFEATTSAGAGLISATDPEQIAFALREARLLITRDQDFLRLNAQGIEHAGIVFWTERRTVGQLIRALDALTIDHTADELKGQVTFL